MTRYFTTVLFIALLLSFKIEVKAQYYITGQDPARLKWSKIESEDYKLIFSDSLSYSAAEWASAFDLLYQRRRAEGTYLKKMPILIHGATAYSNGMVSWAPRRSELYFAPSIDASSNLWVQHLAIHEFRHIQQLSELSRGIYKPCHWLAGEQFTGAILGLFVPQWFLEGDAVDAETRLSKAGRGRNPFFINEYVPSLLHDKTYSYMKTSHGSYKDFVPNYYHMGYQLVNYANNLHGSAMWDKTTNYVGRKFYMLSPFNRYIKNNIGMGQMELYNRTMDSIKTVWSKRYTDGDFDINPDSIPQKSKRYIKYSNLWQTSDTEAIAIKSSYDKVSKLVKIKLDGELQEQELINIGYVNDENLSANQDFVIWTAVEQQGRWQHADKTTIYIYNIKTEKKTRLSFDDFLFSPSIYPDKRQFAAVKQKQTGESILSVYTIGRKHITDIKIEGTRQLSTPVWNKDGSAVYCFAKTLQGKSIIKVDVETGKTEEILPPSDFAMSHLRVIGNKIYFSGYCDERMAIYSIDDNKNMHLCYTPFITASCPILTANNSFVIERDFRGHQVKKGEVFKEKEIKIKELQNNYNKLINQSEVLDFSQSNKENASKKITKYKKSNLINIHSWMPMPAISNDEDGINFAVLSQNVLSTMTSSAFVGYDFYNKKERAGLNISYMALAPIINASIEYSNARDIGYYDNYGLMQSLKQQAFDVDLDVSLPLIFQNNNKYFTVRPKAGYKYDNADFETASLPESSNEYLKGNNYKHSIYAGLYWSVLINAPYSNVVSSFGTWKNIGIRSSNTKYRQSNISESRSTMTFFGETGFILPSFIKRHAIELYGGVQNKNGDLLNDDYIRNARGYKDYLNDRMLTVQGSYKFPIWDIDLALGRVLYIKRIKGQVSYDISRLWYQSVTANMSSYGIGLSAEVDAFNFFADFDIGCQLYRLDYTGETTVGFTLSFNY